MEKTSRVRHILANRCKFVGQHRITMAWRIALAVSLLTAFATAVVAIMVATYVAERYGISDREGARSMSILFFLAPVAFVSGLLFGLLGTYYVGATEWSQFWQATGASLGMAVLLTIAIAGYFLLSAPTTTKSDISPLVVQVEVYIPLDRISAHPEEHSPLQMTLNSGPAVSYSAIIDPALTRRENGMLVVTGVADLGSGPTYGVLSVFMDENNWLELRNIPIVVRANGTDPAWGELMSMVDMSMEEPRSSVVQARVRVLRREPKK